MATRRSDYREPKESETDGEESIVSTDNSDDDSGLIQPTRKKPVILISEDEDSSEGEDSSKVVHSSEDEDSSEVVHSSEDEDSSEVVHSSEEVDSSENGDSFQFPSQLKQTHTPSSSSEISVIHSENEDEGKVCDHTEESCDTAARKKSLSLSSDCDFVSDDEIVQNPILKTRKYARISLALSKVLKTTDVQERGDIESNEREIICSSDNNINSMLLERNSEINEEGIDDDVCNTNGETKPKEEIVCSVIETSESKEMSADTNITRGSKQWEINEETLNNSVGVTNSDTECKEEIVCLDIQDNECKEPKDSDSNITSVEQCGKTNSNTEVNGAGTKCKAEIEIINVEEKFKQIRITEMMKPQKSRHQLKTEIDTLTMEISKLENTMKCIDISKLPDGGMKLKNKIQENIQLLNIKERELRSLPDYPMSEEKSVKATENTIQRLPKGFGVRALQGQIREKTLTEEALSHLHGSINSCPAEHVMADSPKGLRSSVELMPHQKHALAWLMWRETQKPPAGILADDMGLGKTLSMISLILKDKEVNCKDDEDSDEEDRYPVGGTLVVCPASLLMQWEDEIKKHCKRSILEVEIHHGGKREDKAGNLARNDIVLTTYSIVRTSAKSGKGENVPRSKKGVLHRVRWRRIILDEAHVIRNHKSQQSVAVCMLMGRRRWALTGTPIHNKELDLYALLKFLRCSPFDDYNVWIRWVDNKNSAGLKRLNTLINAIMIRRTKDILQEKGELGNLPEKNIKEIQVVLDKNEFAVYEKILLFSKALLGQFLQQKADRELGYHDPLSSKPIVTHGSKPMGAPPDNPFSGKPELTHMFNKFCQMRDIKSHEILVLLLRLRQICVHPGLIKAMLDEEAKQTEGLENKDEIDDDILNKMESMTLQESKGNPKNNDFANENNANILVCNNPVFDLKRISSKMKSVFDVLKERVLSTEDKAIIVSQWPGVLNIVNDHLKDMGVRSDILTGSVPVSDRMQIVSRFNKGNEFQVLLLSLTAGGVGLNLTGGNHLFMIDLHWNPQMEQQAFDRIYRVGQRKPVFIYKFICQETIEERIKCLQEKKMSLAGNVLSGTMRRNVNKITLDDLKTLFSM